MQTEPQPASPEDGLPDVVDHPRESDEQTKKRLWGASNNEREQEDPRSTRTSQGWETTNAESGPSDDAHHHRGGGRGAGR